MLFPITRSRFIAIWIWESVKLRIVEEALIMICPRERLVSLEQVGIFLKLTSFMGMVLYPVNYNVCCTTYPAERKHTQQ